MRGEQRLCSFIAAEAWQSGAPPFCGAAALAGSSYCAVHARLCGVDPTSRRGERIAAEQDNAGTAMLPEPLPQLAACAVPEPLEEEGRLESWELPFDIAGEAAVE